jgi:transcriptional regulator with XRE-family HTH domain
MIINYYDKLKSVSQGYASMDYDFVGYRPGDLVKVDILVKGSPVDALSYITTRDNAVTRARALVHKLRKLIPRQQFEIPLQAAIGGKIIAREDIVPTRKDLLFDIGTKIKELRTKIGMSQKELADKVDLTPSFISQLENNQINPSLNSFIQICNALGVNFSTLFEENKSEDAQWLIKKEKIFSHLSINENGLKGYSIVNNGNVSGTLILLEPYTKTENFIPAEGIKLIYVLKGAISVVIKNKGETLRSGDSMYLKKEVPSLLKNEGGDKAELLLLCA